MDCSERPATDAILTQLRGCATQAMAILARGGAALGTPAERVAAVDAVVRRWRRDGAGPEQGVAAADVPFLFGSLWGEAVVESLGWSWVQVVFNRHAEAVAAAVVSPDRALAVFPIHYLLGLADDPAGDCTIGLAFDRLVAGDLDGLTPGGYANVMDLA